MVEEEMIWQSTANIETIRRRARMLKDIRAFFDLRGVLEVETPLLSAFCTSDPHLNSFSTDYQNRKYFLNTSPEYAMKRLLVQYREPVYQVCKSFRVDESGPYHNPEFTMLEWYRPGFDMFQLMDELEQLLGEILSEIAPVERHSYQSLFERHAGFDPHNVSAQQCRECAQNYQIEEPVGMGDEVDDWLDWLLTQLVLPALAQDRFTIIYDYPESQSALAKLHKDNTGTTVAARFELFYGEIELANGFDELRDATEQENRFRSENKKRDLLGLTVNAVDPRLLAALAHGLPECSGVAVGLDRLLMVMNHEKELADVLIYPWQGC